MTLLALILAGTLCPAPGYARETTYGLGINAWRTVGEVADARSGPLNRDGISGVFSYQNFLFGDVRLEFDVEDFESGYAGRSSGALAPQLYLLYGRRFYVAVGGGVTAYSRGFDTDTANFGALRLGLDLALPHRLSLDVSAGLRINGFNTQDGANEDLLLVGVILRYHRKGDEP
jgi:hypothetical protein